MKRRLNGYLFSVENLDVRSFSCGNKDLDEFLTTDEVEFYQKENLGKTFLMYYEHELVAYFTISMDSLRRPLVKRLSKRDFVKKTEEIPAMKIGRLAVATKHQNRAFGRIIMKYGVGKALSMGAGVGCRFLIVQAKPDAIQFYKKSGFDLTRETRRGGHAIAELCILTCTN
ncbi:MAG: GNAT family N-acetyltransferase [Thermoplasmata archaeon]